MNNCLTVLSSLASTHKQSNGRWSKTEHQRFMKALEKYGRDWLSVQKYVKTRNLSQVRSHAQKVFLKMSDEDVVALIAGESQSDIQNQDRSFCTKSETHMKKNIINKKKSVVYQKGLAQKFQIQGKKNLLDIFKEAIQLQNREIIFENKEINKSKQVELKLQHNISSIKIPQNIEKQAEIVNFDTQSKIYHEQATQNLLQYQQMQFQFPNFKQFCNLLPQFIAQGYHFAN